MLAIYTSAKAGGFLSKDKNCGMQQNHVTFLCGRFDR